MRYGKRDANEPELVSFARQLGVQMELAGPLDWWAGWRARWYPVEIKNGPNSYTAAQVLFLARCKERGTPVWTWRTVGDVAASLDARIAAGGS